MTEKSSRPGLDSSSTTVTDVFQTDGTTIIVDWDGPDDPQNPRNWTLKKKWIALATVSSFTFLSPVSSSMSAPASEQIQEHFAISSTLTAMTVSIFVLAYAVGPLFLGPLSEIFGRSRVLQIANLWFLGACVSPSPPSYTHLPIAWNIGCGFATSASQLIVFRFLAGIGGSAPLSVSGGVVGDLFTPERRGQAVAIYTLVPLLSPILGPIAGGWIAQRSTWRWVYYSTSILDGVVQVVGTLLLKETYPPVLLERKARLIRKTMDEEKVMYTEIRTKFDAKDRHWKAIFSKAMVRPILLFVHEPILVVLSSYLAFAYGVLFLFFTTLPTIFGRNYGEQPGLAGLHYIALGLGLLVAAQSNARLLDRMYAYFKEKNDGVGKPEFRLPSMVPGTILLPVGLLISGWAAQEKVHWIVVDIGLALVGGSMMFIAQSTQSYVIDTFTLYSASALACVNCLRSVAGFGFPLFAPPMYDALGFGRGNTILAGVAVALGCPAPWLLWRYGERIRGASRHAAKGKK
ncbi:MFS polyamine transporter [Artomyces pyxidatus]|uniref:MFS polyamine transporter n=1 Tax=Artomyces pyxidatus TaxID=48021 RepID=A0ACB8SH80_9AGAM|nr:MFS polyamine transporter [Artomyces pyxidatus]